MGVRPGAGRVEREHHRHRDGPVHHAGAGRCVPDALLHTPYPPPRMFQECLSVKCPNPIFFFCETYVQNSRFLLAFLLICQFESPRKRIFRQFWKPPKLFPVRFALVFSLRGGGSTHPLPLSFNILPPSKESLCCGTAEIISRNFQSPQYTSHSYLAVIS